MAETVPVRCPGLPAQARICGAGVPLRVRRAVTPASVGSGSAPVTHHTRDERWGSGAMPAGGRRVAPARGGVSVRSGVTDACTGAGVGRPPRHPQTPRAGAGTGAGTAPAPRRRPDPGPENTAGTPSTDEPRTSGPSPGEDQDAHPKAPATGPKTPGPPPPAAIPLPRTAPAPRPAFQPITVRTARDVVTVAALYLRWLGYQDIRGAVERAPSGFGVADGVIAPDRAVGTPCSLRDVECVWLSAMAETTACLCFSLAGYEDAAHARADALGIPLFLIDLTGTPQPVNSPRGRAAGDGGLTSSQRPATRSHSRRHAPNPPRHARRSPDAPGHRARRGRTLPRPRHDRDRRRRTAHGGNLWSASGAQETPGWPKPRGRRSRVPPARRPVAYLLGEPVDDAEHIEQVSVHPRRGPPAHRPGPDRAHRRPRTRGADGLTLTTFADVPWNAPYYARIGFRVLGEAELTPGLRKIRAHEAELGLDRWPRVAMPAATRPVRARARAAGPPSGTTHPYRSLSSTLRTLPDTVMGKASRIRSRLGIL